MLGSEYNAIIQAAIYGLAVPVIIGISIMFTTGKGNSKKESILRFESEYAQMEYLCNAHPENIYVASHVFYDPRQVLLLETNHQKNNKLRSEVKDIIKYNLSLPF